MKTFIFTTDTEILVAHAETIEDARVIIEHKFAQDAKAFLEGNHSETVKRARQTYIDQRQDAMYTALAEHPYIIEPEQSLIFTHVNE